MKAVQLSHASGAKVIQVPDMPAPRAGEVLLRMQYVGFCGSDLNTFRGCNAMALDPVIPGHEAGAVIEAVGEAVPEHLRPGMTVTVNPYTHCGKCPSCRNRRFNACRSNETLGVQRNGVMQEYALLPWEKVIPAGNLDVRTAALVEPMSVGFHAVNRAGVTDADTVLVLGCGMVGLGAVIRAALRGATVIAADIDDEKLTLATLLGAAHTVNTESDDVHARLQEITDGNGPDVVVEAAGSLTTTQLAFQEAAFTGRVVCVGYAPGEVPVATRLIVQKELDVRGSRNALPEDFLAVIRYLERGCCPVDTLVTRIIAPEESLETLRWWNGNPGKVFRILVKMFS